MSRSLQDELQKARMSEAVEAGQVEIVQLAHGPGFQIRTGKERRLLVGLIVGLLFGFGAAVLVDSLNASIRRRSDLERVLGIPGLAVIPRLSPSHTGARWASKALPRARRNGKRGGRAKADENLVTMTAMQSSASESFRTLRTNLMFSQAVRAMRTLVVTSSSPAEGKTTTATNLAVSFAQQGMRVLLVDGDLRRAHVHRVFGVPREPVLCELVLDMESEEAVTRATQVSGLYVMPAGKLPPNPSELLAGEGMRNALAKLTEGYDLIIIDTPPLLAASDAAIIATLADGVILVVRAGKTDIAAALQSTQQLNAVGARVIGAVLNDPDAQVPKYGAYYKYEYSTSA
jgi:capsular exopolysaccharide synthesis family protein